MRNTKRELPLFSMYDHTGMERHLEEMAVQGWMLEKTTGFGWVYRRCEARRVRYAVTYFPKASAYEPGPSEDKQIFQDYCAQAGWELVSDAAQMQIFRTEAETYFRKHIDALKGAGFDEPERASCRLRNYRGGNGMPDQIFHGNGAPGIF